jgi:hypothetical protein
MALGKLTASILIESKPRCKLNINASGFVDIKSTLFSFTMTAPDLTVLLPCPSDRFGAGILCEPSIRLKHRPDQPLCQNSFLRSHLTLAVERKFLHRRLDLSAQISMICSPAIPPLSHSRSVGAVVF